jgi:hypothetical protein
MEELTLWYSSLDTILQVFWGCAIAGSLVFVIQTVLALIGLDHADMSVDVDVSDTLDLGGGLSLFSIRNLVNFILGFGWAGVSFYEAIENKFLLLLVSVAVGVLFVYLFFWIYKQTKKFEANGAFQIKDCEGKIANVYLRIPANKSGRGKVQISVNGSVHELDAMTSGEAIPTGKSVKIVEVVSNDTLLVELA